MKTNNHNDIDLDNWRHYLEQEQITTDTIWLSNERVGKNSKKFLIPSRPQLPKNSSEFHGLWIPEIPYQFIQRFTKKNDVVWSVFGGSGTDYKVAELLDRKCVINDLNPTEDYIQQGDSTTFDPKEEIDLALLHPPYHNIVQYSEDQECGSNQDSIAKFVSWFKQVAVNVDKYLKEDKHVVLVCGNIYVKSEEIPLGFYLSQVFQSMGYTLKSHIVKDYGETKGTGAKNYNINYYRQLKGGYNNFSFDNMFILKKTKSKNKLNDIIQAIYK